MGQSLDKLSISGFKSIRELKNFELGKLNVLIGGNGAGKSNFVEIFRMLSAMVEVRFAEYIRIRGGSDGFLFNGPKVTSFIRVCFEFGDNSYAVELKPSVAEEFVMNELERYLENNWHPTNNGGIESQITDNKSEESMFHSGRVGMGYFIHQAISNWVVYHFHDTGANAPMRRSEITVDNQRLRSDASNIAPFLLSLRDSKSSAYNYIVETVKLVTPFFEDFMLVPVLKGEEEKVSLSWKQKGSDYPMQPYHFSDGTIRFICLVTALLQPCLPSTIVIDEPELGLHPYAIEILAELMKAASQKTQVIVSTQSPHLIDNFDPGNIIITDREDGASTFKRLDEKELTGWLNEYSLGELWRKNVIAGGPVNE